MKIGLFRLMKKIMKQINIIKRKLVYKFIRCFPKKVRNYIFRTGINLPDPFPDSLRFELADSKDKLEEVFKILHDCYVEEGYMEPQPHGLRVTPYHALPSTAIFVALWNNEVIGTISLIRDNPLKLPLEKNFDLSVIREGNKNVAELSSLAIKKDHRSKSGQILFPLINYAYIFSRKFFGTKILAIAVHPKWRDFYEAFFLFKEIPGKIKLVESYDFANGAPAIGLYHDIEDTLDKLIIEYRNYQKEHNIYQYIGAKKAILKTLNNPAYKFPEKVYKNISYPSMDKNLFKYFFEEKTNISEALSEKEYDVLLEVFRWYPIPSITVKIGARLRRRHDVECSTLIEFDGKRIICEVRNVSMMGMQIYTKTELPLNKIIIFTVKIGEFRISHIAGKCIWRSDNNFIGVLVVSNDNEWKNFLKELDDFYDKDETITKKAA